MPHSANPDHSADASDWHALTARILDAAVVCMSRAGLKVPMQEVAKEAGVSRGVLYRHFAGREDLVEAVVGRLADNAVETMARQLDADSSLADQVAESIRLTPASVVEPLASVIEDEPVERTVWLTGRWQAFWSPRLAAAVDRGEVRPDLELDRAANWIARVQLSFIQEIPAELNSPRALRSYVDEHLMRGLARGPGTA